VGVLPEARGESAGQKPSCPSGKIFQERLIKNAINNALTNKCLNINCYQQNRCRIKKDAKMKYKKHRLNKNEKDLLIERIRSFLEHNHPEIVAAYLFGSFTEEGGFSDIDIGILMRSAVQNPLDLEFKLENHLERVVNLPVDVRLLNHAPLSFCFSVIRNKKIIIDRDSDFRADFESYTLKKYFDFAPFRRRYLAEVEDAEV
jgi:hypothetical protein